MNRGATAGVLLGFTQAAQGGALDRKLPTKKTTELPGRSECKTNEFPFHVPASLYGSTETSNLIDIGVSRDNLSGSAFILCAFISRIVTLLPYRSMLAKLFQPKFMGVSVN